MSRQHSQIENYVNQIWAKLDSYTKLKLLQENGYTAALSAYDGYDDDVERKEPNYGPGAFGKFASGYRRIYGRGGLSSAESMSAVRDAWYASTPAERLRYIQFASKSIL